MMPSCEILFRRGGHDSDTRIASPPPKGMGHPYFEIEVGVTHGFLSKSNFWRAFASIPSSLHRAVPQVTTSMVIGEGRGTRRSQAASAPRRPQLRRVQPTLRALKRVVHPSNCRPRQCQSCDILMTVPYFPRLEKKK